ncbi:MAG: glycosyl hydrolase [Saprospiraceae bacterium]|nr:glycosyl hydrolase [Saprospiraceae bacterium]
MKKLLILILVFTQLSLPGQNVGEPVSPDSLQEVFQPLKYRNIGPFRGGRSVSACGVVGDPLTYYMGTTGGGLWKTEDAGQYWENISDGFFTTGSVGAVAVSESHPNIVFCGMGEHAPRGVMTSYGDGVYKSNDAGKTWKKAGLELTRHIARIIIDPTNPNIVFVAAQGALNGPTKERGIYKSTDGGETWSNVLFVNELTGCAELCMDMSNPLVLYAAMWEHQRLPWQVISGGPGSGLYKSVDGGANWKQIHNGLPEEKGKMAISLCRAHPEMVYALIESDSDKELGGLFASENGGESWNRVSADHRLIQRAWYYTEVFADPVDEHTVYVLSAPALRSIDGGKSWERLSGPHGDYHDLWINPENPRNLVIADDGGAGISFNRGETWSRQSNMPTGQFYRLNVDNAFPYRIYSGQQDNSSIRIASRELGSWGINEQSWDPSAGGESAFLAFDPDNPRFVMGGSYLGTIDILDSEANASTNIMAAPIQYLGRDAKDMKYRYNWNAPIIWSQHEPNTFYHGAQYLLRTRDMGQSWEEISPDLSRNEKSKQGKGGVPYTNEAVGAENYGTISYVIESPHEKGVIWVGTDDGLVQLTKDGGVTWVNVTPTDLEECLVNAIDVSPHDPGTAYIATTRYKFNDHRPGLYKTKDYGKTWTNISKGIPEGAFTRVIREDEVRKDLLFAGTETGVYISWNGGQHWESFQLNLPVTPITDLLIRHDDLIVATSGRALWILDDLELIRQFEPDSEGPKLFQPGPVYLANGGSELNETSEDFRGSAPLNGVNPANGAVIYYRLPELPDSILVEMEIRDSQGVLVRQFSSKEDSRFQPWAGGPDPEPALPKSKGLNRFVWNLRYSTMPGVPGVYIEANYSGHKAVPGIYSIKLTYGDLTKTTTVEILANPLYSNSLEDYQNYHEFMASMESVVDEMHQTVNTLEDVRKQIEAILGKLPEGAKYQELKRKGKALIEDIRAFDEDMVQRKSKAYDDVENFPNKFTAEYLFLINMTESDIPKVNQGSRDRLTELDAQWIILKERARKLLEEDVPAYNTLLWDAGIGALWEAVE